MATYNNNTLISGWPKAKRVPGTVASAIKQGNFLVLASSKAALASSLADAGTKAQNQAAGVAVFLGVAMDAKLAGDARDVLIASAGEHRFPCTALGQAYDIGTLIGIAGTGSGGAVGLSDTDVEVVTLPGLAIGKLSRNAASGATEVYVELAAAKTDPHGGVQAQGATS